LIPALGPKEKLSNGAYAQIAKIDLTAAAELRL
jgi:hypothetical protein